METNERIKKIREYFCNDNNVKFAEIMEENPNTTSNWVNENRKIGKTVLDKILDRFSDVNPTWLLIGEGEMLKNNQQIGNISNSTAIGNNVNGNGNHITHNNFSEMIELQKGYQDLLRKKDDHIGELLLIVKNLTNNGK